MSAKVVPTEVPGSFLAKQSNINEVCFSHENNVGFFFLGGRAVWFRDNGFSVLFSCLLSAMGMGEHFSYSLPPGDQQVTSFAT